MSVSLTCLSLTFLDSDGGYMDMNKEESVEYVAMKELSYADIQPACVHRDLAARNVLVCEGKLVKVCDHGLARDLKKDQDYVSRGHDQDYVSRGQWMSPESIFQNIYSSQSDVWSYGVLLWEIFSLGGSPYPDLPMTQQFYTSLKRGYRMSRPDHAPNDIYDLMKLCWEEKPESRPSFSSLVVAVGNMMTDDYRKRYLQLSEDFLKGENPAVVSSIGRPIGDLDRSTGCPIGDQEDADGSPAPQVSVRRLEAEPEEAGPPHGSYIIPVTDITIETWGSAAPDAVSHQMSESPGEQEVTSPVDGQEVTSPEKSPEEEQSFL
ncbi:hypothetical protein FQN60_016860 [Etheostoma spectabile]|uniref:Protein kinase domain-containing protein n=1 Tax=Etheostoma spectabile TaxID=54343 RepID=A0A5J5C9Q6_9PERO|nr:hypothetical protein FQN60_016860 [Etheostoma spectabile]